MLISQKPPPPLMIFLLKQYTLINTNIMNKILLNFLPKPPFLYLDVFGQNKSHQPFRCNCLEDLFAYFVDANSSLYYNNTLFSP